MTAREPSILERPGRRALLAALCVAGLGPIGHRAAQAAPAPAEPVLELRAGLLKLARRGWPPERAAVSPLVQRAFDLETITVRVLGAEGGGATSEQRRRLAATLSTRLENEILRAAAPRADDGFSVSGVRSIGKGEWLVHTRVLRPPANGAPAEPVVLAWRVKSGARGPRIIDTLRDGQGAIALQHEDFVNALRGHDVEWVISRMERRAASAVR